MAASVGKIVVAYLSGPSQSVEVDAKSTMTFDGTKVGSGGDRPRYSFGPKAWDPSGFREYRVVATPSVSRDTIFAPASEITSVTFTGGVLKIVVTTNGLPATTNAAVDVQSMLEVDGPGRDATGGLGGSRVAARIPLAGVASVTYTPAAAP
jgi:hypothetical protein